MEINTSLSTYKHMIERIAAEINTQGERVTIRIEASASKVPKQRYQSNEELVELRGKAAQKQLISSLESLGIDTNKMLTFEFQSSDNGPAFTSENRGNCALFTEFLYVTIHLNQQISVYNKKIVKTRWR